MSNRVSHFEIMCDDVARGAKFYGDIFGWEIKKWEGGQMEYWMVMTGKQDEAGGINGGMMKRNAAAAPIGAAPNAFVCTIVVDNFDAYAAKIEAAGGKVAMPKMALVGMAWQGYFIDSEGNLFGLHQADKEAK